MSRCRVFRFLNLERDWKHGLRHSKLYPVAPTFDRILLPLASRVRPLAAHPLRIALGRSGLAPFFFHCAGRLSRWFAASHSASGRTLPRYWRCLAVSRPSRVGRDAHSMTCWCALQTLPTCALVEELELRETSKCQCCSRRAPPMSPGRGGGGQVPSGSGVWVLCSPSALESLRERWLLIGVQKVCGELGIERHPHRVARHSLSTCLAFRWSARPRTPPFGRSPCPSHAPGPALWPLLSGGSTRVHSDHTRMPSPGFAAAALGRGLGLPPNRISLVLLSRSSLARPASFFTWCREW